MKTWILCTVLFCVGATGFVARRVHAVRNHETPQFGILKDPSASHWDGCESLLGMTGQVLQTNGAASGSTLTVLILGDQSTANEPWRMGTYSIPTVRKVLEGRSARLRQEQEILRDVSDKCRHLRRTTISPIFLGTTQAIADLHARGCKATSHCKLYVDSDLEENAEPSIKKMLNTNDGRKRISLPRVDNTGIDVVFCGVAVTDGRFPNLAEKGSRKFVTGDSDRVHRMQEVWRSLFAEPASVRFEPYCPNSTEVGARLNAEDLGERGSSALIGDCGTSSALDSRSQSGIIPRGHGSN